MRKHYADKPAPRLINQFQRSSTEGRDQASSLVVVFLISSRAWRFGVLAVMPLTNHPDSY